MTRGVVRREEVGEDLVRDLLGERRAVQAGVGGDPDQRALELADVVADVGGDEREDLVGDAAEVLGLGLLAEDGEAGLELGRLDVGDQAPLEPAAQPVLEAWRSTSGGRSEEMTIWPPSLWSWLNVWKNSSWSSWVRSRNWMSSIRSTSSSR